LSLVQAQVTGQPLEGVLCVRLAGPLGLALKQCLVHLPELALLASALGRLGSLFRLGMNAVEGKVPIDIADLSSVDIGLYNLWQRLTDVSSTERSLVVRIVDDGHQSIWRTQNVPVILIDLQFATG
jgi:hypothetical protein